MEVIDVGDPVRIHARHQRDRVGQLGKVLPVDPDACRRRNCNEVQRVIRRAARRQEPRNRIDNRLLADDFADWNVVTAALGDHENALHDVGGQQVAQFGAGVHEGPAGQLQAHELHEHLVAVGRAVKRAGTRCVIRSGLGRQQFVTADLARGIVFTDTGFLLVAEAGDHRPSRDECHGQMTERQRADQQTRDNLVANAEAQRGIEHVMGQSDRGRQCDDVTTEQRQVHAVLALRYTIAHGGYAAGKLSNCAVIGRRLLDCRRVGFERLVSTQHLVVGRYDADIRHGIARQQLLFLDAARGHSMRQVAAR